MGAKQSKAENQYYQKGKSIVPQEGMKIRGYYLIKMIAETDNSFNFTSIINGSVVVVKFIKLYENKKKMIMNEVFLMNVLKHQNIIECLDIFLYKCYSCIVTPFKKHGTLLDHLDYRFSEESIKTIMKQTLNVLKYLHSNDVIHRDIKLNNIFLNNNDWTKPIVQIADFGCAEKIDDNFDFSLAGTPLFIAPEMYKNQKYGTKIDIWSLGISMYILMSGCSPFPSVDDDRIMAKNVINKEIEFPENVFCKYSDSAMNLLRKMLEKDPSKRISARNALKHHWFKQ